jgi:YjbE family integral membrane protein
MDTGTFLSALLAIVVIDLVLAGDNAIVIALAARNLPPHLQKRAILWGALGAIAVRSAMTIIVVWLLKIPGLLLAGGLALVWIAYKLLMPEEHEGGEEAHAPTATNFWAAMRTIVVADAIMGLDNVLAVAGAAHGSYLLVVLGLLISVPIVMWGSTLVLKLVERFPGVMYIGAGVLAWTAAKMIAGEPLIKPWLHATPWTPWLLYLLVPAVLWAGLVKNHRHVQSRIDRKLAALASQLPRGATRSEAGTAEGDARAALKVLVPVDGSTNALHAVRHAISEYQRQHDLELHLVNVQPGVSSQVARFISRENRDDYYREQCDRALQPACEALDAAKVPYQTHREMGNRARAIVDTAQRLGCHHVVMGTARKNSFTRMMEDSVTNRVLELTTIPVEVISGDAVSKVERYAVPLGLGLLVVLLVLAAALR